MSKEGESDEVILKLVTVKAVPVRWERTRPRTEAVRIIGLFANQNSACPLRNRFTLTKLAEAFGLDEV
jgi:hypothetical protein